MTPQTIQGKFSSGSNSIGSRGVSGTDYRCTTRAKVSARSPARGGCPLAFAPHTAVRFYAAAFADARSKRLEASLPASGAEIADGLPISNSPFNTGAASRGVGGVCSASPSRPLDGTAGGDCPRRIRRAAFHLSLGNTSDGRIPRGIIRVYGQLPRNNKRSGTRGASARHSRHRARSRREQLSSLPQAVPPRYIFRQGRAGKRSADCWRR